MQLEPISKITYEKKDKALIRSHLQLVSVDSLSKSGFRIYKQRLIMVHKWINWLLNRLKISGMYKQLGMFTDSKHRFCSFPIEIW